MLENPAYKKKNARQSTTSDGFWILNIDIVPRRMGLATSDRAGWA